jgi:hypothetical protein
VLEDALRKTFAARVEPAAPLPDPAGRAIRRGRALRRHRRLAGTALAVAATMAFTGGLAWVQQWRTGQSGGYAAVELDGPAAVVSATAGAEPSRPPSPVAPPGVDLLAGDQLWTVTGQRIPVPGGRPVDRAYRVPAGWLVNTGARSWLVRPDGVAVALPVGDRWAVSEDGARVTYAVKETITLAALGPQGTTVLASAVVGAGVVPVAFAGERVVLGLPGSAGKLERFGEWRPGQQYRASWLSEPLDVYEAGGSVVVALVPDRTGTCLTRLGTGTAGLRPGTRAACGIPLRGPRQAAAVSPDGRWLAVPEPNAVLLYDLDSVFDSPVVNASCRAPGDRDLAWEDAGQLLVTDGTSAVRCRIDGSTEPVALPAGLPAGWRFVPSRVTG